MLCINIPEDIKTGQEISAQYLPGGRYAIRHCKNATHRIWEEWMSFMVNWMASSGYQSGNPPYYEIYYYDPETPTHQKQVVDLCCPIEPYVE